MNVFGDMFLSSLLHEDDFDGANALRPECRSNLAVIAAAKSTTADDPLVEFTFIGDVRAHPYFWLPSLLVICAGGNLNKYRTISQLTLLT